MLIKLTVKEMAALALAMQERPGRFLNAVAQDVLKIMDEQLENHEKIVPPPAGERNRVELHAGQLVRLRGNGLGIRIKPSVDFYCECFVPVDFDCECFVLLTDGNSALFETANGPVLAVIDDIEAVEDAKV